MAEKVTKKYLKGKEIVLRIIFIAIVVLGVFLIGRPLYSLINITKEINELTRQKTQYEESIRRDSAIINNLKDDAYLERYAREQFFMHSADEDLFIVK